MKLNFSSLFMMLLFLALSSQDAGAFSRKKGEFNNISRLAEGIKKSQSPLASRANPPRGTQYRNAADPKRVGHRMGRAGIGKSEFSKRGRTSHAKRAVKKGFSLKKGSGRNRSKFGSKFKKERKAHSFALKKSARRDSVRKSRTARQRARPTPRTPHFRRDS